MSEREVTVRRAVWRGTVLAEAAHLTVVSGRRYFPARSVRWDLMREAGVSPGPRELGAATVFDIVVDGVVGHGGAWCYQEPALDLLNVKNLVTFGADVEVVTATRPAAVRSPSRWLGALVTGRWHPRSGSAA